MENQRVSILGIVILFLILFYFLDNSQQFVERTGPYSDENLQNAQSERQNEIETKSPGCIEKAKAMLPKIITLSGEGGQGESIFYNRIDNPQVKVSMNCMAGRGGGVGQNINEFYGTCDFSYTSEQVIAADGTVLGFCEFRGTISSIKFIKGSERYRITSNDNMQKPMLRDFLLDGIDIGKCYWPKEIPLPTTNEKLTQQECEESCNNNCFFMNRTAESQYHNNTGECLCACMGNKNVIPQENDILFMIELRE